MPYTDQAEQKAAALRHYRGRRAEWMDAHPCACGNPATRAENTVPGGIPKGAFTSADDRRDEMLATVVTLCAACFERRKAERAETARERHREHNRAWMAKRRAVDPRVGRARKADVEPPLVERPEVGVPEVERVPDPEWARDPDPAPKRRGRPPGTKNTPKPAAAPATVEELSTELSRRMERRRWREERRERLGYGPDPRPPTCRTCRGEHWPDEDCVDDLAG